MARFNKLHACRYLNEQFNDLGGRDVLLDSGKDAILDRKGDKRSLDMEGKENIRANYGRQRGKQTYDNQYAVYPREELNSRETYSNNTSNQNTNSNTQTQSTEGINPLVKNPENGGKSRGVPYRQYSDNPEREYQSRGGKGGSDYMRQGMQSPEIYGSDKYLMDQYSNAGNSEKQSSRGRDSNGSRTPSPLQGFNDSDVAHNISRITERDDEDRPRLMSLTQADLNRSQHSNY